MLSLTWRETQEVWHRAERDRARDEREYRAFIQEQETVEHILEDLHQLELAREWERVEAYMQWHHITPVTDSVAITCPRRIEQLLN
ncbi:hypothetical protein NVP1139A_64 [Vibrio phage 1.139.A._10N.261.48.C6]|nr:hypothetical protein NVP1034O_63 [Vibrio phage 1.034.O._10N.261.46.B7]AUR83495.1 hypothetical protein NVP1034X_65 [Vibrio phage 1.034.X._10N.261.46.B7]AUR90232.1 hypothetical protein NVP1139A_64 [Vibrio phage 1.139.A._10N.261.48.C6]AUR90300.1 hypothetical protein NVP1139B_65 [Vibrio phage 1.139.B._10N.261.48.C6]AUR95620.1 hypothetical protein NVP1209O_63 [Vibrio phage 1.209.O._10N.222.52.B2]